jgi:hypothetical protein
MCMCQKREHEVLRFEEMQRGPQAFHGRDVGARGRRDDLAAEHDESHVYSASDSKAEHYSEDCTKERGHAEFPDRGVERKGMTACLCPSALERGPLEPFLDQRSFNTRHCTKLFLRGAVRFFQRDFFYTLNDYADRRVFFDARPVGRLVRGRSE